MTPSIPEAFGLVDWSLLTKCWRRGNGFEPPSRAVHARALPIELSWRLWTLRRGFRGTWGADRPVTYRLSSR